MPLFRRALVAAMQWRWITIGATVAALALSVFGLRFVQQQFFPSSDRPEILVDMTLPQTSSIAETRRQMDKFEAQLKDDPDIAQWSSYVGQGAIRFYLPLDQQLSNAFFGQIVIETKSLEARNRVIPKLEQFGRERFVGTDVFVHTLDLGPPVGRPVQYRLSGPDLQSVRDRALTLAGIVSANAHVEPPTFDWNEPGQVLRVEIAQDKARQLGITSQDISNFLNGVVGGANITQVRDSIYLINVIARSQAFDRNSLDTLQTLQIALPNGRVVPLLAFARLGYDIDQPIVWRRDRLPTITVRASIHDAAQPATVVQELEPSIDAFAKALPAGFSLATGGAVEESAKSQGPIAAVVPVMLLVMAFLLMVQLQSFGKLALVVSVGPLGLIGVVVALLGSRRAARLRGAARRPGAHRHHHPQFGDPGVADRRISPRGPDALERGRRGDLPSRAAHSPHRRRGELRHDSDRAPGVLGADGLRDDRRHSRRHGADADLPAGAVRRRLSYQARSGRRRGVKRIRNQNRRLSPNTATRHNSPRTPSRRPASGTDNQARRAGSCGRTNCPKSGASASSSTRKSARPSTPAPARGRNRRRARRRISPHSARSKRSDR